MQGSFDVFVVGGGAAGMALAACAARCGLQVAIAEELMFGGLVVNVNQLKPGAAGLPGSGSDLAAEMMTSLADLGVTTLFERVTGFERDPDGLIKVATSEAMHATRCLVLASGARRRKLGVPGEAEFDYRGVAHCADCDAPMYRDQEVVVVGGGDSALQEALVLAEFCARVHLVHRGSALRARAEFRREVKACPRIGVHLHTVVDAILGEEAVSGVQVRDIASGESRVLPGKGVFAYVGLEPATDFLPPALELREGGVQVNGALETSLPDVFAIGAVRHGFGGQLSHALEDSRIVLEQVAGRVRRA